MTPNFRWLWSQGQGHKISNCSANYTIVGGESESRDVWDDNFLGKEQVLSSVAASIRRRRHSLHHSSRQPPPASETRLRLFGKVWVSWLWDGFDSFSGAWLWRHRKRVERKRGEYFQGWHQVWRQVCARGGKPVDSFHRGEISRFPGLPGGGHLQWLGYTGPPVRVQGGVGQVQKGESGVPTNPTLQLVHLQRRSIHGLVGGRRWERKRDEENEILGRWTCWNLGDHCGSDSKRPKHLLFFTHNVQVVYRDGTGHGAGSIGTGCRMKSLWFFCSHHLFSFTTSKQRFLQLEQHHGKDENAISGSFGIKMFKI